MSLDPFASSCRLPPPLQSGFCVSFDSFAYSRGPASVSTSLRPLYSRGPATRFYRIPTVREGTFSLRQALVYEGVGWFGRE